MKAFLMHRDRDFELERELPVNEQALTQDLELKTLWSAMAGADKLLFDVARGALLQSLRDPDEIVYRQQILTDCLESPSLVREMYELAGDALKAERRVWGGLYRASPSSMLGTSVEKMDLLVGFLRRLRAIADEHSSRFASPGFQRFFTMVRDELDDAYFELVENQLKMLRFKGGMLLSVRLAIGNKGKGYMLRRPRQQRLLERMFDRSGYSFTIPDRDENGFRALGELEDRGVNMVANALAQSVDHVKSFFVMLRIEIGFYLACLNLHERLEEKGEPICFPVMLRASEPALSAGALYDICLTLRMGPRVVGNDIAGDHKSLVMITGANQGGKSTLLRSVGLAQLMGQCGMFVAAESLHANVCDGLFTHYKREEDEAMESGKLDEELARMSAIADRIAANSMLLCNESFASTNEREGSEIARQVIRALLDGDVKVLFVTHMFDLANGFYDEGLDTALFLRAERGVDGKRPFKLSEGSPLPTSYGEDSYRKIFGRAISAAVATAPQPPQR